MAVTFLVAIAPFHFEMKIVYFANVQVFIRNVTFDISNTGGETP